MAAESESKMAAKMAAEYRKCLFSQKLLGIGGTLVLPTNRNMDLIYSYTKFQGHMRSCDDVISHVTLQITVNLIIL